MVMEGRIWLTASPCRIGRPILEEFGIDIKMCCLSSLLSMLSMPKCCMEQKALTSEVPQAFVHSLMRDGLFLILSERVRKNVTSRILEEGRR